MGDLLLTSGEVFQICHLEQLLMALEIQYWHALLLHSNTDILSQLSYKGFIIINPGPYLIEQEVLSARTILRTIIDIYLSSESCQELGLFVTPWISRLLFCSHLLFFYLPHFIIFFVFSIYLSVSWSPRSLDFIKLVLKSREVTYR